jgi:hypothetical protein
MTKKKVEKVEKQYKVIRGVQSDTHGWRFEAGEIVSGDVFEAQLLVHWLGIGVLEEVK